MNKLFKGAIAGAAGVALLVGGTGTFALWNSTAQVDVGTVTSGTLAIEKDTTVATWRNVSSDAPSDPSIAAIADYRIVPGDKLELTQNVTINATGNNLKATLGYTADSISAAGIANEALKNALVFDLAASGPNVTRIGTTDTFAVTPSSGQTTVTLKLTVELPSTISGTTAQNGVVDLSALTFSLAQDTRA